MAGGLWSPQFSQPGTRLQQVSKTKWLYFFFFFLSSACLVNMLHRFQCEVFLEQKCIVTKIDADVIGNQQQENLLTGK